MKRISEKGIEFLISQEGLAKKVKILGKDYYKAYKCPAGVWTIGAGHTSGVESWHVITKEHSMQLLKEDLKTFENFLNKNLKVELPQHQFDMLVSLAFNIGNGNFVSSTLLKKLNNGEPLLSLEKWFKCWRKGGGKVLPILELRRKKEWVIIKNGYDNF